MAIMSGCEGRGATRGTKESGTNQGQPSCHPCRSLTSSPFVFPRWCFPSSTVFVTIDIFTTILQIAGAALIGVSESNQAQGKETKITPEQANNILLSGLALQVGRAGGCTGQG
jgi:hypothetical protein